MTWQQSAAFGLIALMMAAFVWGRFRYDLVAMVTLLVAVLIGVVPADKAFSGFSDDIIAIIASALVVSAAVARSGIVERLLKPISPWLTNTTMQVVVLSATVAALSGFVKNIGALAMLMPVAFALARKTETSPSFYLMPMAFGSLLGGIVTLVGTSPNILVSRVRQEITGEPFHMFDFTPVGVVLAVAGIAFLAVGWRLLPKGRKGASSIEAAFNLEGYTTEAVVQAKTDTVGKTVAQLEKLSGNDVEVLMVVRKGGRRYAPTESTVLRANDVLLLEGEPDALQRIVTDAKLKLATASSRKSKKETDTPADDLGVMEAVVSEGSAIAGSNAQQAKLYHKYGVTLLAVSRAGERVTSQLRSVRLRTGDVVVLRGNLSEMPDMLGELGLLPLAERSQPLGNTRRSILPVAVLAIAMLLVALGYLPIAIAFFGTAVVLLLMRSLTLKEAYAAVEWPILILIGALIPVSDALRSTGGTEVIASLLSQAGDYLNGYTALLMIMAAAMAVTPFLNNAATVLVMGPIAAAFASKLGYKPDPFLMAVAIGAACDFLTPIGHQSNTLVMGPGGYRFGDYWRLGLPLSILVLAVGVPLIALFWPLAR
ncbi:MAG: SLC13 family permease [Xanthobacteraceae bacterium]|nr:SLC13 family permease [Xanthobacteraceae bacterium]MBX3535521.1 SLC13 family permease [Xanthobacteraceae bacterium]MBX3548228.1 SLC13 family permease [Xanthobacteraceae bacterium]MCW5675795.1 SLC13 family permease [Xanthobacteraceae bacterium]MCW5679157.1 SLC13 family permease [Xanthobacteraceae bacterium]